MVPLDSWTIFQAFSWSLGVGTRYFSKSHVIQIFDMAFSMKPGFLWNLEGIWATADVHVFPLPQFHGCWWWCGLTRHWRTSCSPSFRLMLWPCKPLARYDVDRFPVEIHITGCNLPREKNFTHLFSAGPLTKSHSKQWIIQSWNVSAEARSAEGAKCCFFKKHHQTQLG